MSGAIISLILGCGAKALKMIMFALPLIEYLGYWDVARGKVGRRERAAEEATELLRVGGTAALVGTWERRVNIGALRWGCGET